MTDDELIAEILVAAKRLQDIQTRGDFDSNDLAQLATERLIEIIGDMVGHFSLEFQAAHPEIEYRNAKRMRNVLAHHYLKLEPEKILNAVDRSIPTLVAQLRAIANQATSSNPSSEEPN